MIDSRNSVGATDADIAERVFVLIEKTTGMKAKKLRDNPGLELNRTIDGDDASELMKTFEREFGVDMQNYSHDHYFGREGIRDPFSVILGWLRAASASKYRPLTALDLIHAAKLRRWPRDGEE